MRVAALLLLIGAASLPPARTANWLTGGGATADVVLGAWFFKVLLGLHACLLWWYAGRRIERGARVERLEYTPQLLDSRQAAFGLAALLVVGAALRFVDLGAGLWFDEVKTLVQYVTRPLGEILTSYDDQNQHMLYSLSARIAALGEDPGTVLLRLPAVAYGVAGIGAIYLFARLFVSRVEALVSAALLTFSYHHVWFSQNARGYTALLLWSLISTGLFVLLLRNVERNAFGLSVAYGGATALALFTHMTAAVLPAAHLLVTLLVFGWRAPTPRPEGPIADSRPAIMPLAAGLVLAGSLSLLLYAFVLPQMAEVLLSETLEGVAVEWKSPAWLVAELGAGLAAGLPGGWLLIGGAAVIGLVGLVDFLRSFTAATFAMVLPVVITVTAIIGLGHNLWPRFFFFAAGFAIVIGVRGIFASCSRVWPSRGARLAALVGFGAALASGITVPRAWGAKQSFVEAAEFVARERGTEDAVVTLDMAILPYRDYVKTDWVALEDGSGLPDVEARSARTWLVLTFTTSLEALQPEVWERIQRRYEVAARFPATVRGGEVLVMVTS